MSGLDGWSELLFLPAERLHRGKPIVVGIQARCKTFDLDHKLKREAGTGSYHRAMELGRTHGELNSGRWNFWIAVADCGAAGWLQPLELSDRGMRGADYRLVHRRDLLAI